MPNEQSGARTPENPWRAGTQTGEQALTLPKSILKSSIKRNPPMKLIQQPEHPSGFLFGKGCSLFGVAKLQAISKRIVLNPDSATPIENKNYRKIGQSVDFFTTSFFKYLPLNIQGTACTRCK